MTTQHIETLIIGAGQAGLSTGYHLQRRGRPFLIVDGADRVGDNWRHQWDTLRLYTPAKYDGLPGLPFPADDPWHFPGKDEVAAYLEQYALHFDLPVRMSTRIDRLQARPDGGFVATIGADTITCDNVVVATGTFGRTPLVPAFAGDLDPGIRQLHSSEYRRPDQLAPGTVLVVGGSHSGMDIAYESAETHDTILCGRDCGQIPVRLESRRAHVRPPGDPVHVPARAHPSYADGPQGDARGAVPRRAQPAHQEAGPGEPRRRAGHLARRRGQGRQAAARRRPGGRRRRPSSGAPASSSASSGSSCRSSGTTAGRWSTAESWRTRRGCTSAG